MMWFMWMFVGVLLVAIAALVYFNEGGPATIEIFVMIGLVVLFMWLDLWQISAVVVLVWGYRQYLKNKRKK